MRGDYNSPTAPGALSTYGTIVDAGRRFGRTPEGAGARPITLMIPEPNDPEQSAQRVRRGCVFIALTFVALAVLFVSSTGNLFYLLFILVAVALLLLSRTIK